MPASVHAERGERDTVMELFEQEEVTAFRGPFTRCSLRDRRGWGRGGVTRVGRGVEWRQPAIMLFVACHVARQVSLGLQVSMR